LSINVLKSGFQSTIQDLGRNGFSHYGISKSGAADDLSIRLGNLIVGNNENAASIEMTLVGGEFKFDIDSTIVLTGSKFAAMIDNKSIPFNEIVKIRANQTLSIGQTMEGARCYLAVKGGIEVTNVFSSKTTHLTSKMGGIDGRALIKDDQLMIGKSMTGVAPIVYNNILDINMSKLLIIKGIQENYISKLTWKKFLNQEYKVSNLSSRMGIRLEGESLNLENNNEIITEGVPLGAIQLPRSGNPIISFVEHQTTGGYPKIANVISSEMHKVGQLKPGDKFKFELISLDEAEKLHFERENFFDEMKNNV